MKLPRANAQRFDGQSSSHARPAALNGFAIGVGSAMVVAVVITLLCTRHGIATASDSARYVRTARIWLGVERAVPTPGISKAEQAHFPPFYSALLAAGGLVTRQDPLIAARWLQAATFAATTLLVGVLVRRATRARWPAVLAAFVVALSPVTVTAHAWLATEALFITFALLTILLIAKHIERPRWSLLTGAAVATSLGMLTRYAGASMGPAAVAALLLLPPPASAPGDAPRSSWHRRWLDAGVFSVLALAMPLAWAVRNVAVGGSATNRTLAWHPVSVGHLKDAVASVATWLSPLGIDDARAAANSHPAIAAAAVLLFAAVCFAGCNVAWRRRREPVGRIAALALLAIGCFVGLLMVSISLADFHTPMDTRVLAPVFVAWVVLAGSLLGHGVDAMAPNVRLEDLTIEDLKNKSAPGRRSPLFSSLQSSSLQASQSFARFRAGIAAACVAFALAVAWPSAAVVRQLWHDGGGFAHPHWRESPTLAAVHELPPEVEVYTNAPSAVYLVTGRLTLLAIPSEISASTRQPNPDYADLMARITLGLRERRGVVVWCKNYGKTRAYYPTEAQIRRRLGLVARQRFADGAIFEAADAQTVTERGGRDGVTE